MPDEVATTDAAGLPLAGLTALQALFGRAGLAARRSPRVLVHGASGGIGSFGVQLAVLAGAHVTGTASPAKHDYVRALGAHDVIDRQDVSRVGRRWDVVLDAPGRLDPAGLPGVLTPGGIVVTTRVASLGTARSIGLGALGRGPRVAFVATAARSPDLAHLLDLVRRGLLRVPVDRVFPLTRIADAHRYAEGGQLQGKIVLGIGTAIEDPPDTAKGIRALDEG